MKNFKLLFATLPLALLLTSCGITKDNNSDVKSAFTKDAPNWVIFRDRATCKYDSEDKSLFGPLLARLGEDNSHISLVRKELVADCEIPVFKLRYEACTKKVQIFSDQITYELKLTGGLEDYLNGIGFGTQSQNGLSLGFVLLDDGTMDVASNPIFGPIGRETGNYPLLIDSTVIESHEGPLCD